jgi:restriction endonuclease S subunit
MPNKQDNGQFDILISNPPYSVDAFRRMLKYGAESFDLYSSLTDNSSEIECLFIERMKQLLKVGGLAGVILPSSMLSNGGIYSRARDIIFKYFNVKAIVELGSGTFMETGTNTVILFLERRPDNDHEKINQAINAFFTNKHDITVSGIERVFSAYVANVYDDLQYEDYVSFINGKPSDTMKAHELWIDYEKEHGSGIYFSLIRHEEKKIGEFLIDHLRNKIDTKKLKPADLTDAKMKVGKFFADYKEFSIHGLDRAISGFIKHEYDDDIEFTDYVSFIKHSPNDKILSHRLYSDYISRVCMKCFETEKEKMLYFILTYNQNIVVAKSGQKQDEKAFLGYEFCKRRGSEGLKLLSSGSMLYDENDIANSQKVNSYILNAFLGKTNIQINETVAGHVFYGYMSGYFEYGTNKFTKRVNLNKIGRIASKWPQITLSDVLTTLESGSRPSGGVSSITDGSISIGGEHIGLDGKLNMNNMRFVPRKFYQDSKLGKILPNDVLICKDGALTGKVCMVPETLPYDEMMANEHVFILRTNEQMLQKYLFSVLFSEQGQALLRSNVTGQAQGGLNATNLKNIKIPLPTIDVQKKIISDFEANGIEINKTKTSIIENKQGIVDVFLEMFGNPVYNPKGWNLETLSELGDLNRGISKHRPRNAPELLGGEHPLIQTGEVAAADLYITDYTSTYSDVGLHQSRKWPKGTLCITIAANIAKTAILDFDACFPDSIVGFISSDKVNHVFLHYWFSFFQKSLEEQAPQLAQKNINLEILRNLKVIVPPFELQNDFARFCTETHTTIAGYQNTLNETLKKRNEILSQYL